MVHPFVVPGVLLRVEHRWTVAAGWLVGWFEYGLFVGCGKGAWSGVGGAGTLLGPEGSGFPCRVVGVSGVLAGAVGLTGPAHRVHLWCAGGCLVVGWVVVLVVG